MEKATEPVKKLSAAELRKNVCELMAAIHVITACKLPQKEFRPLLIEELEKTIIKYFSNLNFDQLLEILREYSPQIEDYNRALNVNFFHRVMRAFRNKRSEQEYELERSGSVYYSSPKPSPEQMLSDARGTVEYWYQEFLKGRVKIDLYPPFGVATIAHDGYTVEDYWEDFRPEAERYIKNKSKSTGALDSYLNTDGNIIDIVAKKRALLECFKFFKHAGFKAIYYYEENECGTKRTAAASAY